MLDTRRFPMLKPNLAPNIEKPIIEKIHEAFKGKTFSIDFGFVTHVYSDYRVDIDLDDDINLKSVPIMTVIASPNGGLIATPEPGDQAIVGFIVGDKSAPIVLGFIHNNEDTAYSTEQGDFTYKKVTSIGTTTFKIDKDGNFELVHKTGSYITIDESGKIKISAPTVDINGSLF